MTPSNPPVRLFACLFGVFAVLAAGAAGAAASAAGGAACPESLRGQTDLGRFAFVSSGRLELLDPTTCTLETLVRGGVVAPLRWSADGRYLAFGAGAVVAAGGGAVSYPLGKLGGGFGSGSAGWLWSPRGHLLAGVTAAGGVAVGGPGERARQLFPAGWGATSVAFGADGASLAVSRSRFPSSPAPYDQQVWLVTFATGQRREVFHESKPQLAPPYLWRFTPNGRWLLAWEDSDDSASLAADGLPLVAIPLAGGAAVNVGGGTLLDGDFLGFCGARLVYVLDEGGREVTQGDRIVSASPPRWRTVELGEAHQMTGRSAISPACAPDGAELAAAVGPQTQDDPIGQERRSIWLLPNLAGAWTPLVEAPARGVSDELPLWSSDGRWLAFVRTTWSSRIQSGTGELYLIELSASGAAKRTLVGPVAKLGAVPNYDGYYNWTGELAWSS